MAAGFSPRNKRYVDRVDRCRQRAVELDSSGTIKDATGDDTGADITAGTLTIQLDRHRQFGGKCLNVSVTNLAITSTSGNAFLTEANGIALGTVNVGASNLNWEVLAGDITDNTSAITAGNLSLTVTSGA